MKSLRLIPSLVALFTLACAGTANTGFDPDAAVDPDADPNSDGGGTLAEKFAVGVTVDEVAIYQAVKIDLMRNGGPVPPVAPIVANRAALVRVFLKTDPGFTAKNLTGKLYLRTGGSMNIIKSLRSISGASVEADQQTTFDFTVDGAKIGTDSTFSVAVLETGPVETQTGDIPARYPRDGSETGLGAKSAGNSVKIRLFPITLTANGLTGDSDASSVATWLKEVRKIYPIPNVEISVQPALSFGGSLPAANGSGGWGPLLNALTQKRQSDGAAADIYYYGVFKPNASFASYCGNGCVAGLSNLSANIGDAWARAGIGLGYGGNYAQGTGQTMAHEIGHAHGRNHAPCGGAQGIDPGFPDSTGGIGTWGYDIDTGALFGPNGENISDGSKPKDIMGYCDPKWISTYTYKALFTRIVAINGAAATVFWDTPRPYRQIYVLPDGTTSLGDRFEARSAPMGEEKTVTITLSDGSKKTVTGNYYEYDHLPGGYVLVPEPPKPIVKAKLF